MVCRLCMRSISIHALREEGDHHTTAVCLLRVLFLSTPSARRATLKWSQMIRQGTLFLSTPSARRATIGETEYSYGNNISIHALREEGDLSVAFWVFMALVFLSTPSARRATRAKLPPCPALGYFYPRPPRGGRPISIFGSAMDDIFLSTPSARRATARSSRQR